MTYERPIVAKMTMMKEFETPNRLVREDTEFDRELTMKLYYHKPKPSRYEQLMGLDGRWLLHFSGGPTGCETYYAEDLLYHDQGSTGQKLGICAGTVNSWPRCEVSLDEVMAFLLEHIDEIKEIKEVT